MTTATLRPNGTVTAADSVTGGSGTTHGVSSDNSDTSYYTDNGTTVLNLGTVTLPAGSVFTQVRARHRGRADSTTVPDFTVYVGSSTIGYTPALTAASVGTGLTTRTGAWFPKSLTQSEIDALLVRVRSTSVSLRTYELYVDVMYVEQPALTMIPVTDPWTESSALTISWTPDLDADGGPVTHREVRLFSQSQFSAPGFDVETSPSLGTTVEASASSSRYMQPRPAGTYRAYVRIAQTVNGSQLWSDWAFDEYTIDVDTADIDTVTVVADNVNAKLAVTASWDSATETPALIEVERSDDYDPLDPDVATWVPVRGATLVAWDGSTAFVVDDYEAPIDVDAVVRARATWYSSGLPIVGDWVTSSTGTSWTSSSVWLKVPGSPELNQTVDLPNLPPRTHARLSGRFQPPRRERPIVVTDVRQAQTGQYTFLTYTADQADALLAALEHPVVLLQGPPGLRGVGSRYLFIGDATDTPGDGVLPSNTLYGAWTVSYEEVDRPPDPDAGEL